VTPQNADMLADPARIVADGAWRRHQMPAYHLVAPGGEGITLVNIGVGPSMPRRSPTISPCFAPKRG
jgi:hypothetical protein